MTNSMLNDLVRLKLPRDGTHFEVITLYNLLEDSDELERLGLTAEQSTELQLALASGKMKASSFEGYIISEREYRDIRNAGWPNLLWG